MCMWESPLRFLFPSMVCSALVSEKWNSGICQASLPPSLLSPSGFPRRSCLVSTFPAAPAELPVCVHAHSLRIFGARLPWDIYFYFCGAGLGVGVGGLWFSHCCAHLTLTPAPDQQPLLWEASGPQPSVMYSPPFHRHILSFVLNLGYSIGTSYLAGGSTSHPGTHKGKGLPAPPRADPASAPASEAARAAPHSPGLFAPLPQVPGCRAPVLVPGDTAHPLRQHPGPRPQTAALLPELRGDHAQCGRGRQDQHRGVPAPVPRPQVELHHYRQQPGHLWPRAGQRYASRGEVAACWCRRPEPAALLCPRVPPAPGHGSSTSNRWAVGTRLVIWASLMWFLPMVPGAEGASGAQEGHGITQISLTCPP